uniref:Elongation factor 1-delta n=1 Tax=Callorhinchus milii TaxID=7868 RepID=A0A4W3GTE5_CALMI
MAGEGLAQEKVWFDKYKYDNAERQFYENLNRSVSVSKCPAGAQVQHWGKGWGVGARGCTAGVVGGVGAIQQSVKPFSRVEGVIQCLECEVSRDAVRVCAADFKMLVAQGGH